MFIACSKKNNDFAFCKYSFSVVFFFPLGVYAQFLWVFIFHFQCDGWIFIR